MFILKNSVSVIILTCSFLCKNWRISADFPTNQHSCNNMTSLQIQNRKFKFIWVVPMSMLATSESAHKQTEIVLCFAYILQWYLHGQQMVITKCLTAISAAHSNNHIAVIFLNYTPSWSFDPNTKSLVINFSAGYFFEADAWKTL